MDTIYETMRKAPPHLINELIEKNKSNFYDKKLKLTELAKSVDVELDRLYQALKDAVYSKDEKAAEAVEREIQRVKDEVNAWFGKHKDKLTRQDKLHRKYKLRRDMKVGAAHSYTGFDPEYQRMTALYHLIKGERYAKGVDIRMGNDPKLKFTNVQHPEEANLSSFDIKMFYHIVCGWVNLHGCRIFVRPAETHISLSAFLPTYDGDKRLPTNKKVYVQLSRDLGVWNWNGKKAVFDWKATTKNIQTELAHYYDQIIEGNAGDIDGTPGSDQVKLLAKHDGDLSEFMRVGGKSIKGHRMGDYEDRAISHVTGRPSRRDREAWYAGDNAHRSTKAVREVEMLDSVPELI